MTLYTVFYKLLNKCHLVVDVLSLIAHSIELVGVLDQTRNATFAFSPIRLSLGSKTLYLNRYISNELPLGLLQENCTSNFSIFDNELPILPPKIRHGITMLFTTHGRWLMDP
jgi:hypothetical protein